MPRTRSLAFSELKIGIIGVAAVILATALIIAVGGQAGFFWQQFHVKTQFANVQGMKSGAVVRVAGKDVGKVTDVAFNGSMVDVSMALNEDVLPLVTANSRASLGSLSLLGEPIVDLSPAPGGAKLAEWAYIPSTSGGQISDLTAKANDTIAEANKIIANIQAGKGTVGKLFTDEAAYRDFDQLLVTTNRVASALESTRGTAGMLLNDRELYTSLKKSVDDLNAVIAPIKAGRGPIGRLINDEEMATSMKSTVANLQSLSDKLKRNDNTLGALVNDKVLYDRLTNIADKLDKISATLQGTTGTAGKLLNDDELYKNMNKTLVSMNDLLADIRKDPKKYLRVSVSIF